MAWFPVNVLSLTVEGGTEGTEDGAADRRIPTGPVAAGPAPGLVVAERAADHLGAGAEGIAEGAARGLAAIDAGIAGAAEWPGSRSGCCP